MKKLIFAALLLAVALVACKKDPNDKGKNSPDAPKVFSEITIGNKTFEVKTINPLHGLLFASQEKNEQYMLAIEGGQEIPENAGGVIAVHLGEASLQDVYDKYATVAIPYASLIVVSDKEFSKKDLTGYDWIPVVFIPEEAWSAIQEAKDEDYGFVDYSITRRADLFSSAKNPSGKQFLNYSSYRIGSLYLVDVGCFKTGKVIDTPYYDYLIWDESAETNRINTETLSDEATFYDTAYYDMTLSNSEVPEIILGDDKLVFAASYADYTIVERYSLSGKEWQYNESLLFKELKTPVALTLKLSYDVMLKVNGEDFPIYTPDKSQADAFLAMGANVPIVFIDGYGEASDYTGLDVAGSVAVCWRGSITFSQKYDNAKAAGAMGIIVANNQSGIVNASINKFDFPFGTVTKNVGDILKDASRISFVEAHE